MIESLVAVSPPNKRLHSELSSSKKESDLPEVIFPIDERDFNTSLYSCYPLKESKLDTLKVTELVSFAVASLAVVLPLGKQLSSKLSEGESDLPKVIFPQ